MLVQERAGSDPARIVNHYDALHRRVRKEVYEKPGGNWVLVKAHTFIYDGWNVIEERQFNSGGTLTLTALTRLTWGADLSGTMQGAGGVGGLLMAEEVVVVAGVVDPGQSPTAHYYWYDGNGNVTGITDDTGAIEATYRYTSFGGLADSTTVTAFAAAQPWKFSTKYHDHEVEPVAGTYYYGYRSYLPSVGRWPSRDPIWEWGGINLYGMAGNKMIFTVDNNGLQPVKVTAGPLEIVPDTPPLDPGGYQVPDPRSDPSPGPDWKPQSEGRYCYKACANKLMTPVNGFKGECPPVPVCSYTACAEKLSDAKLFAESALFDELERVKKTKCCKPSATGQIKRYFFDRNAPQRGVVPPLPYRIIFPPAPVFPPGYVA